MPVCPQCQRHSLEFSEVRKAAWCLYIECGFHDQVANYTEYVARFEEPPTMQREEEKKTPPG